MLRTKKTNPKISEDRTDKHENVHGIRSGGKIGIKMGGK